MSRCHRCVRIESIKRTQSLEEILTSASAELVKVLDLIVLLDVDNLLQAMACRGCRLRMPKIPDDEGAQRVIGARELWLVDEHPSEELQSHGRFCVL